MGSSTWLFVAGCLVATGGWLVVVYVVDRYQRWTDPKVVDCPGSGGPAAIDVRFDPMADPPGLRVVRCSHWPERSGCSQQCNADISTPPPANPRSRRRA